MILTLPWAHSRLLLQFGFETTATNFTPSGVWLDNITFAREIIDGDADGIDDEVDNCLFDRHPDQRDTDGDGFGNACDADLNNDGVVNVIDLGILRACFFTADPDADFDGNGVVNVVDLGIMRTAFSAYRAPRPVRSSPWSTTLRTATFRIGRSLATTSTPAEAARCMDASTPEGNFYFHTGWGGAGTTSGFYGVAVRNFDNSNEQIAVPAVSPTSTCGCGIWNCQSTRLTATSARLRCARTPMATAGAMVSRIPSSLKCPSPRPCSTTSGVLSAFRSVHFAMLKPAATACLTDCSTRSCSVSRKFRGRRHGC